MGNLPWSGFIVGALFGIVAQRGYLCFFSGFTDAIMLKNYRVLKAAAWAVLVALIGFYAMDSLGYITLSPKPFFWGANIAGGLVFGVGMALIGGCTSGATFKMGMGMLGYFIAGIAIGIGGLIAAEGFLSPGIKSLQNATKITVGGATPTLSNVLSVNKWVIIAIISALLIWLLVSLREKKTGEKQKFAFNKIFKERWNPALTGILAGIIGMIAFYASSQTGRKYPLGIVEGYIPIIKSFKTLDFSAINWMYMLIIGMIAGSLIAAIVSKEFKFRIPGFKQALLMAIGGLLIGVGAVTAAGCNVTHILSGFPQLSIGSIVSAISIFAGAYAVVYLKMRGKKI